MGESGRRSGGPFPLFKERRVLSVPLASVHSVASPLRYPGGKSVLSAYVSGLVDASGCRGAYVEPYAGGAGIALRLLAGGKVSGIVINDMDANVHAFWDSAVNDHARFMRLFDRVEPTIEQWHHWRAVLRDPVSELERGFAFFFLNRTCRSGVINGGVIGGLAQRGRYRVDARYNKEQLRGKLEYLGRVAERIEVRGDDGVEVVRDYAGRPGAFVYADPPYVVKGSSLYLNAFDEERHRALAEVLVLECGGTWMLTYDDAPLVEELYGGMPGGLFSLRYSAANHRIAREAMVFSRELSNALPTSIWERE
ncbi:DNA methyltransferase [Bifidobacterium choerinum]|uniref:site-specific DNA-methyltransferase (adenine-specific) n=1 Tax=Bifidobacterium choerinum TaxID=35760 RepID=A0A2D3D683_9BIFI|nr:DNA methyltransferase [Bifidobacterium choerinum]